MNLLFELVKLQLAAINSKKVIAMPTTYDAAFNPAKDVNGIHPEKWTNKPTNQDLTNLKLENKKLVKQINLLETTVNTLCKKLKQQEKEKARLNDEFHTMRLNDEDYKCRICLEVFIKPILTNCSHMFCEYCIDIWLSKSDKCPTCHVIMDDYSYCLNMGNFIKRMMEQMPEKVKMNFKKLEDTRSKYKPKK
ncbi:E3 ubiquitin-protein ligase RNF8-like [Melanaphis sacchari]|uniref:E3 ubiquitin-protein ligase RNF8-like n=1 Tax=Melanaphis sacchari TaxID=742174 RepID=UPI000DC14F31|nr:E3 ubiquitin-protein ligase RNF8-like [Melanaphis sacchari]